MIGYCKEEPSATGVHHVSPHHGVAGICRHVADHLPRPVQLDHPAEAIYVDRGRVVGARVNGHDIDTDTVISTLPVNRLPQLVHGTDRLDRFRRFRFRGLVLVNLKLNGRGLLPDVVVWTPHGFPYFRVTETPLAMPWTAPDGKTMILCELGAQPGDETWNLTDDQAVERCLSTLEPLVDHVRSWVTGATVLRQPLGYPVFALEYEHDRADLASKRHRHRRPLQRRTQRRIRPHPHGDAFWRLRRRIPAMIEDRSQLSRLL